MSRWTLNSVGTDDTSEWWMMCLCSPPGTLLAVSVVASLVPMRRAMRVDPVIAMRGE
ncbi:MAG: hypothetical protein ABJF01_20270 [bacterium]